MTHSESTFLGVGPMHGSEEPVQGEYVTRWGEEFYCIRNYDRMPPFFMSVVSSSDHWMFISSTGGLTAGRTNSESALFPYYTDDKVTQNHANTGPLTVLRVTREEKTSLWEPFSDRYAGVYRLERRLYKNIPGNVLVFEETNFDLGLTFSYAWRSSEKYGFVRSCSLSNDGEGCFVSLLDGLQNLVPSGVSSHTQNVFGNLLNAYKRNEIEPNSGLGIFALSSKLTDLAEPSESLRATVAWQVGLAVDAFLLSSQQIEGFRKTGRIVSEDDICGHSGAYLAQSGFTLEAGDQKEWMVVAEVNQDSADVARLLRTISGPSEELVADIDRDIEQGTRDLDAIVASADGIQESGDRRGTAHHYANVLFNVMRGGIFAENYSISRKDLLEFVQSRNKGVYEAHRVFLEGLPEKFEYMHLLSTAGSDADVRRLCYEYLPLTFSRRHGDPSRPWNQFSINIKRPDGGRRLDYQGNWRDIFQNWEPLAWSYPHFVEGMIAKFVNATTGDGYNPYRVTRDGIDWEIAEPNNPWANIGYWSDHQVIYLQKLLEFSHRVHPGQLQAMLHQPIFSIANVSYRIKPYESMLEDPAQTITFEWDAEREVGKRCQEIGSDGKLVLDRSNRVVHVSLAEKLLVLLLAKLNNLVPEGGIWMNTQRPEWNDANNALVGKGLSVVTLGYLYRSLAFLRQLFRESDADGFDLSAEVAAWFHGTLTTLNGYAAHLSTGFSDATRRAFMDELGTIGSAYRQRYYEAGLSGESTEVAHGDVLALLEVAHRFIEQSLEANRRSDKLFHAYNILQLGPDRASIGRLDEMLEGQVSILSSGVLSPQESLDLLRSLRNSRLYRADQHSYLLYPQRRLAGFLEKNRIPSERVQDIPLVVSLMERGDRSVISRDVNGALHFNGDFRNAKDVRRALGELATGELAALVERDGPKILELFEEVFNHAAFTGRSGSFFAYEGMGSIYWHMVSKLLLAVQEVYLRAEGECARELAEVYFDVRSGLGYHKTPDVYGAFPTDPYSHTPAGQGAKQPGMTGQVKEEILTRFGELGVFVENGTIAFRPKLLRADELTSISGVFRYVDIEGQRREWTLPAASLAFTFCQVPIVYRSGEGSGIAVHHADGTTNTLGGTILDSATARHLFDRDGNIAAVEVWMSVSA